MHPLWNILKTMAVTTAFLLTASSFSRAQESLTLSLSGNSVSFNLTAGSANNPGNTSITATTVCSCFFQTVNVYAYFNSSASALTQAGFNIPSSAFQISNNGGAFQALTNTTPYGGAAAGIQLSNFFTIFGPFGRTHNDTMQFNINLSGGTLPNLPPGTYTGTLNIQAQAP